MAGSKPSTGMIAAHGVVKVITLCVGFITALLGIMAVIGVFTSNGWARVLGAVVILVAIPAVVVDRMLPENEPERAKGLPTDIFAIMWLCTGLLFIALARTGTSNLLVHEGDRLGSSQMFGLAQVCYTMAGVRREQVHPALDVHPVNHQENNHPDASHIASTTHADAGVGAQSDAEVNVAATDAGVAPTTGHGPRPEQTPAELFRNYAPGVVTITARSEHGVGGGTGFIIDNQGTLVTNHHVIDDAREIKIRLFDGTEITEIDLLADDDRADLALLRINTSHRLTMTALGDSEHVVVGERATAIGNPLGLDYTLTDGLISARRVWHGRAMIQFSVPVSPGNSGGPLFNSRGEVVGVVTEQAAGPFERAQNLNLAIPINVVKTMIQASYPNRRRFGDPASAGGRW